MIKNLLKLLFIVIIGVLVYNYFLGTPEEKANAKEIFGEVKDVVVKVKELVKSEREKFDTGKYNEAVDKIGEMLDKLKSESTDKNKKHLGKINELERRKNDLKASFTNYNVEDERLDKKERKEKKDSSELKMELDNLLKDTEELIANMELDLK